MVTSVTDVLPKKIGGANKLFVPPECNLSVSLPAMLADGKTRIQPIVGLAFSGLNDVLHQVVKLLAVFQLPG